MNKHNRPDHGPDPIRCYMLTHHAHRPANIHEKESLIHKSIGNSNNIIFMHYHVVYKSKIHFIFYSDITMEIKASNPYQASNNFGFDSDIEEEYVNVKPNSDPDVKSNSDSNNKSDSDPDIKSNSDPDIEANSNSITQDSNATNIH